MRSRSSRRGCSRSRRRRRPRPSRRPRSSWKRRFPSRAESTSGAAEAVEAALRSLRHRDRSVAQLDAQLAARGVSERDRSDALATLARTGLVDDRRFAETRAAGLADRGAGNAFIQHDLALAGVDDDTIELALTGLEDERARADRIVARRGPGAKTARFLAGKGFSEDVVYAAVAHTGHDALG